MEPFSPDILWMVVIGFLIAFVLAFGIGANDVANSFGTSVGSGVLTIRQACLLATICEISGAVLIGYKVSDTMRKGILEVSLYEGSEKELMLGCVSALLSSAIWLLVATFLKLPISGTHSIVGSTVGFSLVARGTQGLKWSTLATIVASWFVSPVMSGCVSIFLFLMIRKFILRAKEPLRAGFRALPVFYGVTFFINIVSVLLDGPKLLYMDNIPTWLALVLSLGFGVLIALLTQLIIVPMQKRKIAKRLQTKDPVKFHFEDSVESSPSGSPRKNRRPLSLVSDGKHMPAIAEITELVSLTDNSPKTYKLAPTVKTPGSQGTVESYKINPEIIKKAEDLLGKVSLDNTDLTITSLNFIDEQYQNGNGNGNGDTSLPTANGKKSSALRLQDSFRQLQSPLLAAKGSSEHPNELPKTQEKNGYAHVNNNNTAPATIAATTKATTLPTDAVTTTAPSETTQPGITAGKKDIKVVESGTSLELMISSTLSPNSSKVPLIESKETINDDFKTSSVHTRVEENEDISMLFSFLQILTAIFGSFAHGGNDVSNAIGPLIALYMIYKEGSVLQQAESPIAILIYGGIGISIGLWLWGRRVIETIGNDLTKITTSTGFTIEVGAAITVLLASKIGLPISTTHCKVGSVVFVGHVSSKGSVKQEVSASTPTAATERLENGVEQRTAAMLAKEASIDSAQENNEANTVVADGSVDWHLFRNIAYAWIVTVPMTALLSAGAMFALCSMVLEN